jgi:hypothetical protein
MAEDEFDDEEPDLEDDDVDVDDLDEDDLDLDDEDDVLDTLDEDEEGEEEAEGDDATGGVEVPTPPATLTTSDEEEDEIVDLDEELHPDDVEEPLDVLLQERTASGSLEDEDTEDEEIETDERGDGPTRILPRRADEFLCSSCFLVLPRTQLADEAKMVCRDCA